MAKREQINTPKGVFKYCHLNRPDVKGAERFGGDPMYKVTIVLDKDGPGVEAFLARLDKLHHGALEAAVEAMDEANPKQKAAWKKKGVTEPTLNPFYDDEVDEDGEPTGRIEMRFKTHASFKDRKTGEVVNKTVPFVDGKGQIIPTKKRPLVFGGTIGRVAFSTGNVFIPKEADAYLGLYLNQIQITKLGEGGGGSAFGADEDSDFSADDLEEYEGNTKDEDDDDGADDGFGGGGSSGASQDSDDDYDDEIPF